MLGIVGAVLFVSVVFGAILGILAIVFGTLGRAKAARGQATNGSQALAGIILGVCAVIASLIMLFVYIEAEDDEEDDPYARTTVVRVESFDASNASERGSVAWVDRPY
ncbi:hypothetical protein CD790_05280 [Streptomyces sp. SAJ15]|nr:hypothetical protein CD790_05280 [Streptomyces sp. SAJ15]